MTKLARFYVSFCVGLLACMTAMNLGLPFWRNGPIGDGFDYALTSFLVAWFLLSARKVSA